ncbi:MAG TPA: NAD(P)H-hydrate dehydratase [Candidatus Acidoferrum sp.]|nr:NAD(P)H-hydrate dehydratase [Candidatus Acidoferrum sp.]
MKALTAAEMREVDRLTTERFGIPSTQLMENAGQKAADVVLRFVEGRGSVRVCVLCGKGNNGGDGFVAARLLKERKLTTRVILFGKHEDVHGDAGKNLARWLKDGGEVEIVEEEADWLRVWTGICASNVIVDAMLGTGLRGGAGGMIKRAIGAVNARSRGATAAWPGLILAVDTPSGLPADDESPDGTPLFAHRTVTFTAPKIGQLVSVAAATCGALEVVSIGSPSELIEQTGKGTLRWAGPDEFASMPLVRAADSNKGTFGHVLLVAGSLGKSGAAVMAGYACMRAGAGLTTIACPDVALPVVASAHPEYMTEPLASTGNGSIAASNLSSGRFGKILESKTVLAIGPGVGRHPEAQQTIRHLVHESVLPIVLDADGLNCFAGEPEVLREHKSLFLAITPHPGEMARLLGIRISAVQSDRLRFASEAARRCNAYVVLKGFHTLLAAPDGRTLVNTTGGPSLAKGGTGDVLTGVLAALTAQFGTEDWLRVLALGVFLHGTAADLLALQKEPSGVLAHEVAQFIPEARECLLREIQFGA